MARRGRPVRFGLVLLAVAALVVGPLQAANAGPLLSQTYADPGYSPDFSSPPTRTESQSKIWFHDGSWWALLTDAAGHVVRVNQLMPDHTWHPTTAVVDSDAADTGDALQDGNVVHVVLHHIDGTLEYVRLTYDPAARTYSAAPPRQVSSRVSEAAASIAKDVSGRLWVAFATAATVIVTFSDDGGQTWWPTNALFYGSTGLTTEVSGIVAFDDRVGIMWSDQPSNSYVFAWHRAGDSPFLWTRETALTGQAQIDHHIALVPVPGQGGSTLVAAIKTARGDSSEPADTPMIELLIRTPDGHWSTSTVSTVGDGLDHPVLQVDPAAQRLYVFASAPGGIVAKQASLSDLRFTPGPGDMFLLDPGGPKGGALTSPTVTKDPVDASTGIIVLASDTHQRVYRHAEMPVTPSPVADPNDHTPPTAPGALHGVAVAPDTVVLTWTKATDGGQWSPAADGVPVTGYVVSRGGVRVATVPAASTSFQDRPRSGEAVDSPASVVYEVQAIDAAGNRSVPARVVVELAAAKSSQAPLLIGLGLLGLALITILLVAGRRLLVRSRTARHDDDDVAVAPPPRRSPADQAPGEEQPAPLHR